MAIPRSSAPWYRRRQTYVLLSDLALVVGGSSLALDAMEAGWRTAMTLGGMHSNVVLVAGVAKAWFTYQENWKRSQTHDLEGCLHTLHALLRASDPQADEADPHIRVTIHIPLTFKGSVWLEQLCPYVGDGVGRTKRPGRRLSVHYGIIGDAYRTRMISVAHRRRDDPNEYLNELQTNWHFTEDEAQRVDLSVMSFIAVPLLDNSGVAAVLYADAKKKNFFTAARRRLVENACYGIALFIGRRYNG
jgi:hypothetical protein